MKYKKPQVIAKNHPTGRYRRGVQRKALGVREVNIAKTVNELGKLIRNGVRI